MIMKIPAFYRILIIDDKFLVSNKNSKSKQYKEFFYNAFASIIWDAADNNDICFETVFTGGSADGYRKWQDEVFDLTLIDSDFSEARSEESESDLAKYVLTSQWQGFDILSLLHKYVNTSERKFNYRKKMCRFFLWSGLPLEDKDVKKTTINKLFREFSLEKEKYFISKDPKWKNSKNRTGYKIIRKCIKIGVERSLKDNGFTVLQNIERLLFALRKNYDNIQSKLSGGCLIIDKKREYPFLKELPRQDKDPVSIRICPEPIPNKVLTDDIPFVPLYRSIYDNNLNAVIKYVQAIINDELDASKYKDITNRCQQLRKREKLGHITIPVYQKENSAAYKKPKNPNCSILDYNYKNRYIAAVTPLTSTTVIGHEQAIDVLHDKVIALLNGPFGAVILKTVYLDSFDQWNEVNWPAIQVQSHNRTRCLFPDTGTATIWHTGRTALEMLQPLQLNQLLKRFLSTNRVDTHRVIISLGSKFRSKWPVAQYDNFSSIWATLFEQVFSGIHEDCFPIVEINVRHFLREIVKAWIGGDEYLHPHDLKEEPKEREDKFRDEFNHWLQALHDTAVIFSKKLILKFPHRSDTLSFVQSTLALRTHFMACNPVGIAEFGVRAITLVNALKTPVPHGNKVKKYTPGWYAHPWAWEDASSKALKYQMSGGYLAPYRNQLLAGLIKSLAKFEKLKMEILISGGITKKEDVEYLKNLDKEKKVFTGFQIGTWALIKTSLEKQEWNQKKASTPYSDAKNRENSSNTDEKKPRKIKVSESKKEFISPRIAFCDIRKCKQCGKCHKSFFCDSFMYRVNTNGLPPQMDSRNCSGCGLCVQLCKHGALHLYHPEEMLVLVSSSMERQEILRSIGVPFLAYNPSNDLDRFSHIFKDVKDGNLLDAVKKAFNNPTGKLLTNIVKKIWEVRLDDEFLLGKGRENLYPDLRSDEKRQEKCRGTATDLIKKLATAQNKAEELTIARAVIWSQLIWSDPGQVLWDSHILTLKTILRKEDEKGDFQPDTRSISDLNHETSFFIISSYVVLMRQGEIILSDWLHSEPFNINELNNEIVKKYNAAGMGKDRLAGLDVRACGDFLIEDFSEVEEKDRQAMAGLPWNILREKIPSDHKTAFMSMHNAVSSRDLKNKDVHN